MTKNISEDKAVRPGEEPCTLIVNWTDKHKTPCEITGAVSRSERFEALKDPDVFNDVKVITHGRSRADEAETARHDSAGKVHLRPDSGPAPQQLGPAGG